MADRPPDFNARALFAALARHDVEYVTIGGVAMQAHGGQRVTQDLDIAIAAAGDNRERLAAALPAHLALSRKCARVLTTRSSATSLCRSRIARTFCG